mgnify:CR=1 FL=1
MVIAGERAQKRESEFFGQISTALMPTSVVHGRSSDRHMVLSMGVYADCGTLCRSNDCASGEAMRQYTLGPYLD